MKKVSLKNLDALGIQKLSRETLKNVTGGSGCLNHSDFRCSNDTCIPITWVRDGWADCPDGADEATGYCTCTLYRYTGAVTTVDVIATSSAGCTAACKVACQDVTAGGGDCEHATASFTP